MSNFQFGATVNKAFTNILVEVFVWTCFHFSCVNFRSRITASHGKCRFYFLRHFYTVFHQQRMRISLGAVPIPHLAWSLLYFSPANGSEVLAHCDLIWISFSPVTNIFEHCFNRVTAYSYIFLWSVYLNIWLFFLNCTMCLVKKL